MTSVLSLPGAAPESSSLPPEAAARLRQRYFAGVPKATSELVGEDLTQYWR